MGESGLVEWAMHRLLASAGLKGERTAESAHAGSAVRSVWSGGGGDGRMHHLECGAGQPVVLLHGGTGGGANWFRVIGPLSAGFRVLAPDLPGFGLSDPIAVVPPLGEAAATRLLAWLEWHGLEDVLVAGTSFGGLAALRLAQRTGRVSRLLLLDSAGLGRGIHSSIRLITGLPVTRAFTGSSRRGTMLVLRHLLASDLSGVPEGQLRALVDYLMASGRQTGARYAAETLRRFASARGQQEVLDDAELAQLSLPVSVVWGARDRLLPVPHAHSAARMLPDATLRISADAGHSPSWEQPAPVVDAIVELASRRAHALPERRRR